MSVSPAEAGFFTLKDGVYVAPMASLEGKPVASFFVCGAPIAMPQTRASRFNVCHDNHADSWKSLVVSAFTALKQVPLAGRVELNLQFIFERPKKDAVRFWQDSKPADGVLEEAMIKALTQARAWQDTAQVIRCQSFERYALQEEKPGVHVEIVTLPQTSERGFITSLPRSGGRGSFSGARP